MASVLCRFKFLLVIVISLWTTVTDGQFPRLLTCFCNSEPNLNLPCESEGNRCMSDRCIFQREINRDGEIESFYDCLPMTSDFIADRHCTTSTDTEYRICCSDYDLCNMNLTLPLFPSEVSSSSTFSPFPTVLPVPGNGSSAHYKIVTITVPIVSIVIIAMVITSAIVIFACIYILRRRKRILAPRHSERIKIENGTPIYSPYSLDTLDDLIDQTCTSGSGSGQPLLSQRTIARSIKIGESIGKGGFGQVFVGDFQSDKVAIKKFASRDEKSWFRETEIYNTVLLRHDNILGFFASDVFSCSKEGITELWLITQYHPHGSLYDYLNLYTVPPKIAMRMAVTMCRGLTHLHTEFSGTSAKPAIAHRDIKSKNILVKNNRECCIADFGLAVIKGPSDVVNFPMNPKQGTKRYMAPEILDETIKTSDFESFKKVDIYAFGLVLWEIWKRCCDKNDTVGEYEAPFHDLVGADPSFEEMKKVVVMERRQPAIPSHWRTDDLFRGMVQVMKECWYFNSAARNNAIFYKNKLYKLAEEDKINFDDHE